MHTAVMISRSKTARQEFKRAVKDCSVIATLSAEESLNTVGSSLVSGSRFSYIFVDETFEHIELASFIENAKRTSGARRACFILIADPENRDRQAVGNGMMAGFHAFISKPFSAQSIEETALLATKVQSKGSRFRLRVATGLLLSDIMHGQEAGKPVNLWKEVEESCEWFKNVTGDSITVSVVDPLYKISAVERVKHYRGVSQRVRNMIRDRLRSLFLPSE